MDFAAGQRKQGRTSDFSPLKALISPRPIGWISHLSPPPGVAIILAPYSFFIAVAGTYRLW